MALIYKITNTINNKVYIGQTSFSLDKRLKEHIQDAKKHLLNRPLYSAFNKYGVEKFQIELIEETDQPNEREQYWIQYYHSNQNGYNATSGGEGRPYEFTAEELMQLISLYNQKYSLTDIASILQHDIHTISNKLKSMGFEINRFQNISKEVYQIDKQTNKIIQLFPSVREAARALNKPDGNTHIAECCRGERKTAYGFKWQYVEKFEDRIAADSSVS